MPNNISLESNPPNWLVEVCKQHEPDIETVRDFGGLTVRVDIACTCNPGIPYTAEHRARKVHEAFAKSIISILTEKGRTK